MFIPQGGHSTRPHHCTVIFLHSLTPLISTCLTLWNSGKVWEVEPFFLQKERWGMKRLLYLGGPTESLASLVAQTVKYLPTMWETRARSWVEKIPWRRKWQPTPEFLPGKSLGPEDPGGLQSMGSQRVGHD